MDYVQIKMLIIKLLLMINPFISLTISRLSRKKSMKSISKKEYSRLVIKFQLKYKYILSLTTVKFEKKLFNIFHN